VSPLTVIKDDDRPPRRPRLIDEHAGWLFDHLFAVGDGDDDADTDNSTDGGMTYEDAYRKWGWDRNYFFKVVHVLRLNLAGEDATVTCEQEETSAPWVYRLTGDPEAIQAWHANRLLDAETRLETIKRVAESAVHATNGRTTTGRRARKVFKAVGRLMEDLQELREEAI